MRITKILYKKTFFYKEIYVFRRKNCYFTRYYYAVLQYPRTLNLPERAGWLEYNMFKTTIQMLNGDSMFLSSRQSAATDVIAKSSTPTIPVKFRNDIETLKEYYAQDFREGLEVRLTLKEALVLLRRDRKMTDAYTSLASWMKANLGIILTIISQKTK